MMSKSNVNKKIKELQHNSKGITLVALVVTIVILIILATVSINVVLGEGGLIQQAKLAKELASNSTIAEEESMNTLMAEYANIMASEPEIPEGPTDPTEQEPTPIDSVTKGEVFEETTKVSDASGDILYVPKGFGIATDSPNEIDEGIVITNEGDTKQFVWIPVNDESLSNMYNTTEGEKTLLGVSTKTSIYSNLRQRSGDSFSETTPGSTSGIREPDVLSSYDTDSQYYQTILNYGSTKEMADAMVEEYNTTYQSIQKYDGFYIGRFELTGSTTTPTVQKGQAVLTNQNWYNLYKACKNVVTGEEYGAQSTMIYGNQWDEVCSWLKTKGYDTDSNSASWGNYNNSTGAATTNSGSKQTSGKNEAWQANNIYDLAGNCYEWTQEVYYAYNRVVRGGFYGGSGSGIPTSGRSSVNPTGYNNEYSSRPVLYVALNAE